MAIKEIIVTVDTHGQVTIAPKGYKGKSCLEATKQIEEALGIAGKRNHTAEFHQTEVKNTQQQRSK